MSSIINFYNNLSDNGVMFFWIVIFLFIILFFLLLLLLNKNKKLAKMISEDKKVPVKEETLPVKAEELPKEELLPIEEKPFFKEEGLEEVKPEVEVKPVIRKEEEKIIDKPKIEEKKEVVKPTGPYQRNILKELNARTQTSPIHIDRDDYYPKKEEKKLESNAYLEEDNLSPLVELEDRYKSNEDMEKLVRMMEEDVKPSNIELTEYEKKEEEEAIISYEELSRVKDKIYNITEDEETDEFLDELKSFRLDLE